MLEKSVRKNTDYTKARIQVVVYMSWLKFKNVTTVLGKIKNQPNFSSRTKQVAVRRSYSLLFKLVKEYTVISGIHTISSIRQFD